MSVAPVKINHALLENHTFRNIQIAESDLDGLNKGYKIGCVVNGSETGKSCGGGDYDQNILYETLNN